MPIPDRLWDSSVIIGYLGGQDDLAQTCNDIIDYAETGGVRIYVSTLAMAEVAYLQGLGDQDSEEKIREFFGREYVLSVNVDPRVAEIARELVRKRRDVQVLKPPDAIHLATAIQWNIPVLESTDPDLIRLDGIEGSPPITIRLPTFEGPARIPGL